ncbi:hypothetical protein LAZ67_6000225 [Cordylochernes scorpioides]|uniref:Uncharacterized protein n=1 Tax=Cordylochernes scorpioides TaxID=51811 RepID=A0ABY6KIQ4_9ARAC|nr:hypothetical protein LAZ67_6000225 [Cordylochernes scorpioides]
MEWVVNPFMHCEIQHLEEEMQENLIDLKNDLVFKRLFTEKELSEFWLCLNSKFPKLSNAAIESLLPFGSSYLCEQGMTIHPDGTRTYRTCNNCPGVELTPTHIFSCPAMAAALQKIDIDPEQQLYTPKIENIAAAVIEMSGDT